MECVLGWADQRLSHTLTCTGVFDSNCFTTAMLLLVVSNHAYLCCVQSGWNFDHGRRNSTWLWMYEASQMSPR